MGMQSRDEPSSFEPEHLFAVNLLGGACFLAEVAGSASQALAEDHGHAPGVGEARTLGDSTDVQIGFDEQTSGSFDASTCDFIEHRSIQCASEAAFQRSAGTPRGIGDIINTNRLAVVRTDVPQRGADNFVFGGFCFGGTARNHTERLKRDIANTKAGTCCL